MAKNDHRAFAEKILHEKDEALRAMLSAGEVPLRYGECCLRRATLTLGMYRAPNAAKSAAVQRGQVWRSLQ